MLVRGPVTWALMPAGKADTLCRTLVLISCSSRQRTSQHRPPAASGRMSRATGATTGMAIGMPSGTWEAGAHPWHAVDAAQERFMYDTVKHWVACLSPV